MKHHTHSPGRAFLTDRRAFGTALAAAFFTIMGLGAVALIGDHNHLTYQRDLLKSAADSASLAAVTHMAGLSDSLTDTQVVTALETVARRYVLANIPSGKRTQAQDTLSLTVTPNRERGTVLVEAEADLGGLVFGGWLYGNQDRATRVKSGTQRIESLTEVVLAIDTGSSMGKTLDGKSTTGNDSRLATVKEAAADLVDILAPDGSTSVAIGIVPWDYLVRFDDTTQDRFLNNDWAVYPTKRFYPNPYDGSYQKIGLSSAADWYPDPDTDNKAGESADVPKIWEKLGETKSFFLGYDWLGCVDERKRSGDDPPGFSAAHPKDEPFTMSYYSSITPHPSTQSISYECKTAEQQTYYYDTTADSSTCTGQIQGNYQYTCAERPNDLMPLTTDMNTVKTAINNLEIFYKAPSSYSTTGVVWGHRLLDPAWQDVWDNTSHPADPADKPGVRKVLVLLTDGEDDHYDAAVVKDHRDKACTAAKNAGIKVYTIAAMNTSKVGTLSSDLTACSSQADDSSKTYAFVNNNSTEVLKAAFESIAEQLVQYRRIM